MLVFDCFAWLTGKARRGAVRRPADIAAPIAALALAVSAASPASAAALGRDYYTTDQLYSLTATWLVGVNITRKSCFVGINYANGVNLIAGLDRSRAEPRYYLMFGSKQWDYAEGGSHRVSLRYYGADAWIGTGVGVRVNAIHGVALEGLDKSAIDALAKASRVGLKIEGQAFGRLPLTGTRAALAVMDKCIDDVASGRISIEEIAREYEEDAVTPPPSDEGGAPKRDTAPPESDGSVPKREPEAVVAQATGTGFFVNGDGYLLTSAEVVAGCADAVVRQGISAPAQARILARDDRSNLALLKVDGTAEAFATFRGTPEIRLGEAIAVFGYPLTGYLSSTGNLTTGLVSALTGLADDDRQMQISAPVQSGAIGSAVVDQAGRVVGIVDAKANLRDNGTEEKPSVEVIQNVNFATNADMAKAFLDANHVRYAVAPPGDDLTTPAVADIARKFTAQVSCGVHE